MRVLSGVREMRKAPDVVIMVDTGHEAIAVNECNVLGIPVIGLVDSNSDPTTISYPIPCNDDSIRAVELVLGALGEAIAEGLRVEMNRRAADSYEEKGQEVWGEAAIPDRDFTVRGKMDYVERGIEGYGFVDFKTGMPAKDTEVAAGFDPQLPLAAFILREGGLRGHKAAETAQLGYMRIKGSKNDFAYYPIGKVKPVEELVEESVENLTKLIDRFDDPLTPYESQVRSKFINSWSDFDDLARRGEWAGIAGGDSDA